MKKLMRCLCLGAPGCGKTSMLLTLNMTENILSRPYIPTIEDTYLIQTGLDTAEKPLEHVTFYDMAGIMKDNIELKRSLVQITDWFVLVFSLLNYESFEVVDSLKKYLDKNVVKEKKDSQIVLIGTMADADAKRINSETIKQWATREKIRYFEICTSDRASIVEVVHYMVGKQFHAPREPKFSLSKKLKPDRSNAQILMDF